MLLQIQRNGAPAVCKSFSYLLTGVAKAAGMRARPVVAADSFDKYCRISHAMTEVWVTEVNHWILMDSMSNVMYALNGEPASAIAIYDAVHTGQLANIRTIHFRGALSAVDPDYLRSLFQHLYVGMTNATFDGYQVCFACSKPITFAHLSTRFSPDYQSAGKEIGSVSGFGLICSGIVFVIIGQGEAKWRLAESGLMMFEA